MFKYLGCTLLVVVCLAMLGNAVTPSSFLSKSDKTRLQQVFASVWDLKDLASVHYAVLGYKLLGETIPKPQEICKYLQSSLSGTPTVEAQFYVTGAASALGNCPVSLPASLTKALTTVLSDETSSVADIFFSVHTLRSAGQNINEPAKLVKTLQAALKKDDSLMNLGYSFHIASQLGPDGVAMFDRIEDAVVQADEVNGKYLQFEGGLSITALIVSGAYKLAAVANKNPPITADQAVKFANYFMSRKSVQLPKGSYSLLDVVTALTSNKYHLPVAITMASRASVSLEEPKVQVRVTDILGRSLGPLTVTAETATRVGDEVVVLSKKKFEPVAGDNTLYEVNLMETKPERGFYKLSVSAVPPKPDPRFVGNVGAVVQVKVLSAVAIENVEIGTADADQTTPPKLSKVVHPNKLSNSVEADLHQKLMMKFNLKDKNTQKTVTVHQAFVRLTNAGTGQEIIFVAEPDSTKSYRFDMDVAARSDEFGRLSGLYTLELIIGDAVVSNSFSWQVADIKLKFSSEQVAPPQKPQDPYKPKPEIKHLFREPDRRPPAVVSNLFTGLVCVPVLLLLGLWAKLGINISNFPLSLSSLGFHLGLGGIFGLFVVFWLQLNMFQTLKYLIGLGVVTFLCGNKMLSKIAEDRRRSSSSDDIFSSLYYLSPSSRQAKVRSVRK